MLGHESLVRREPSLGGSDDDGVHIDSTSILKPHPFSHAPSRPRRPNKKGGVGGAVRTLWKTALGFGRRERSDSAVESARSDRRPE